MTIGIPFIVLQPRGPVGRWQIDDEVIDLTEDDDDAGKAFRCEYCVPPPVLFLTPSWNFRRASHLSAWRITGFNPGLPGPSGLPRVSDQHLIPMHPCKLAD